MTDAVTEVVYQPVSRLLPITLVSLYYGTVTTLKLAWDVLKQGPSAYFGQKDRSQRPAVLDDPQYGTHHFADMKNIRLHYVAKGSEDQPLMLFLHGFPEFWYSWRHQLKEFGQDYRAVALDMRGYGESDRPQGAEQYHMSKLVDDVREFIEHIGYKKCILVVHDWGGVVGWFFAMKYPQYVDKFITCNAPNPIVLHRGIWGSWKQFRMSWYIFMFQNPYLPEIFLRSRDIAVMSSIFAPIMRKNPDAFSMEDIEAFKYTFQTYDDFNGPINYYRAMLRYSPEILPRTKVDAPTLVIWGCKDHALDQANVEQFRNDVTHQCDIKYLKNASHWVQQEEPELVNRYIREFISSYHTPKSLL